MIIKRLEYFLWVENFWLAAGLSALLLSWAFAANLSLCYYSVLVIVLEMIILLCGLIITLMSACDHGRCRSIISGAVYEKSLDNPVNWKFFCKLFLAFLLGNLITGLASCLLVKYCGLNPTYKLSAIGILLLVCLYLAGQKCLTTRSLIKQIEAQSK